VSEDDHFSEGGDFLEVARIGAKKPSRRMRAQALDDRGATNLAITRRDSCPRCHRG
jgi:hypothetical protein